MKKRSATLTDNIDELDTSEDDEKFKGLSRLDQKTQTKVLMIPLSQIGQPKTEDLVESFRKKIPERDSEKQQDDE